MKSGRIKRNEIQRAGILNGVESPHFYFVLKAGRCKVHPWSVSRKVGDAEAWGASVLEGSGLHQIEGSLCECLCVCAPVSFTVPFQTEF